MTLGKPVGAFPMQDHMAHFQAHLQYAMDPIFGSNPIVAPVFTPACLEHLKQHLTMWYLTMADTYTSVALGRPYNVLKIEPTLREAQQLLAAALQHVHQDSKEQLAPVGQAMAQMLQMFKQLQQSLAQTPPPMPVDPNLMAQTQALTQTAMAETQRKAAKDQQDLAVAQAKIQAEAARNTEDNLVQERIKAADISAEAAQLQHEQLKTALEAQHKTQSSLGANQ